MKLLFSLLLLLSVPLFGAEEIRVLVSTEAKTLPIYLAEWSQVDSEFPSTHLEELLSILQFDLNVNGAFQTVAGTAERKQLAKQEGLTDFEASRWQRFGVLYVLRGQVKEKRLHIRLDSISKGGQQGGYTLQLKGDLAFDRRQMHRLADALHKEVSSRPGIAETSILYTIRSKARGGNEWRSEVWIADYDGGNARPLTRSEDYCVTPCFVPPLAGKASGSFAYVSYTLGQPKIYIASLKDSLSYKLTSLRGNQLMPAIAPTRDQIAFISDAAGRADLFLQKFDPDVGLQGKPRQLFTAPGAVQASPTFKPDGKQLAFVSSKDGSPRIYILDLPNDLSDPKKAEPRLISRRSKESTAPSWSPDGHYIAYSALTEGIRQIWIYDLEKREERQITKGPGHKENASWAKDSFHLIYNGETATGSELYLTDLNQTTPIALALGPGEKRFPCWAPLPH